MGSDKRDKRRSRSRDKDRSEKKNPKKRDDKSRSRSPDRDRQSKSDYRSKDSKYRDRSRSGEKRRYKDDKETSSRNESSRNNDKRDSRRDDKYDSRKDVEKNFGKNKNEIIIEISQEERQGGQQNVQETFNETDLIPSLQTDVNYLTIEYNKRQQEEKEKAIQEAKDAKEKRHLELFAPTNGRAGGVYVPPYKLRLLQEEMMKQNDGYNEEHQKLMWDLLRKSINGIVNKINISNIQNVIVELLNENLVRGKGLFARAIIKAQLSSPSFTHVYAALIAVINTKMPEIVDLIIRRVILQFQRSYKRNNKLVCEAAIKMIAHLINQRVLSDYVGLQLIFMLLEDPNEDKVDLSCQFMIEAGQVLSETTPEGVNAIFERLKGILHEGECERRIQYSIEHLFAVRKTKYKDHPGVIPELDLVEDEDIIEHNYDLLDQIDPEDGENVFKLDPNYEKSEKEWESIKLEILGEENILSLKQIKTGMDEEENDEENPDQMVIKDLTDEDRVNLRRTLYLVIMSSVDFEECAHKILKMRLGVGHEEEICQMILECCQNERTYLKFYGLLAQRFCEMTELYKDKFMKAFVELYSTIHRYETAKIRNSSKFYAHLFYTDSIDWRIFACITLTQETTTASSRIFIKNLILEICENTGLENLTERFNKEEHLEFFNGLFPIDHPRNTRFAINFFISIGLGALTERLNEHLKRQTEEMQKLQYEQQLQAVKEILENEEAEESSSGSSSSDSSSDSSDSDDSSDEEGSASDSSDSDDDDKKKKKKGNDKKKAEQKSKSKKK